MPDEFTAEPVIVDVVLPIEDSESSPAQLAAIAEKLGVDAARILDSRLRKHSIDARQKRIKVQLRFEVGVDAPLAPEPDLEPVYPTAPAKDKDVLIIGCGPAGLFAALRCLERGYKPILLERGKDASARRFDLGPILKKGTVIEDSTMVSSTPAPRSAAPFAPSTKHSSPTEHPSAYSSTHTHT